MSTFGPVVSAAALRDLQGVARVLDARPGAAGREAYARSHLDGALHVDLDRELAAPADPAVGGRHPLPELERFAERVGTWGIGPTTPVVAYDDQAGASAAARLWWMMRALGHEEVAVLDGGLRAAVEAGLPMSDARPEVAARGPYPHRGSWRLPIALADEVDRARGDDTRRVIDVRAGFRYRGESEPFDPVAGHIPGAINLPYAENLGPDGRFKSPDELRALYGAALGPVPPERAIVHCGSGVTACHTLLGLALAGMPGAALYVGSWSEWCRGDRPRLTGG